MTPERSRDRSFVTAERLQLPEKFPFPYTPENFTEEEKEVLLRFFTNVDKPVYAVHSLPQEVVGALFSRYSRAAGSARRIFLDEFWGASELGIQNIATYLIQEEGEELQKARERAKRFYENVFAQYGDDSVIQMGGVHVAFEFVSQIATKAIEDQRLAAYIEKSTRYVDFSNKVDDHFLFIEPPEIMTSPFAEEFLTWNNSLFEAYTKHVPAAIDYFKRKYPLEEQVFEFSREAADGNKKTESIAFGDLIDRDEIRIARAAWNRAVRAKALDTIRVFLPTTTATNLGAFYSGQAAEHTINKMLSSPYTEVRLLGAMAWEELVKVAPSFLQNVDHRYGEVARGYLQETRDLQREAARRIIGEIGEVNGRHDVLLVDWDEDADVKVASQLVYTGQGHSGLSKGELLAWARGVKAKDLRKNPNSDWSPTLVEKILSFVPDRKAYGRTRRQKLPRPFEHAFAEVEFKADFGIFRDLQRNRMSSTERQLLSAEEIFIPEEFYELGMEAVLEDYKRHGEWTRTLHQRMIGAGLENPAEYVTMLGNKLRFNIRANIRQWVFFAELRTIPGGHPTYRRAMQKAVRQIVLAMPFLEPLFAHVDWTPDYGIGRLKAEVRTQKKLEENE